MSRPPQRPSPQRPSPQRPSPQRPSPQRPSRGVVAFGGAVLDRHLHLLAAPVAATSNPASARTSAGGVARNVAENLALLGVGVRLVSRVGDDDAGELLRRALGERGVDSRAVVTVPGAASAQYVAVLDPAGELVIGVAAMGLLDTLAAADLDGAWPAAGEWLFADCNPPAATLHEVLRGARERGARTAVDAVSTPKAVRLAGATDAVDVLFCNADEARALAVALGVPADGGPAQLATGLAAAGPGCVVLTRGRHGVLVAAAAGVVEVPAVPAEVVDVTGAGDALVAATLARLVAGEPVVEAVRSGVRAAALTVSSPLSVRPDLAAALAGPRIGDGLA